MLAGGPGTVTSHSTAAALHEFPDSLRAAVEITAPPGRQPRARGAVVHRSTRLDAHDVATVGGIPTTSYARTLVDCTGLMSLGQVARALDAGLIRRSVTVPSVERTLRGLRQTRGRHPSKLWTLLGERGGETALAESRPEMRVARVLRDAGLPTPAQQYWIRLGGSRFRLDFAYPEVKVAIEYDGWDAHRSRTSFDADRRRDRLLTLDGWIVLRFTSQTSDAELIASVRLCQSRSL